jgi:hypothetical protein
MSKIPRFSGTAVVCAYAGNGVSRRAVPARPAPIWESRRRLVAFESDVDIAEFS